MASPEFDAALALTEWQRDKADWVKSMANASELAAGYQARAEKAEAALARVLALHVEAYPGAGWCSQQEGGHGEVWPCATSRALEGTS